MGYLAHSHLHPIARAGRAVRRRQLSPSRLPCVPRRRRCAAPLARGGDAAAAASGPSRAWALNRQ
eukprot:scaffold15423_cov70-Phaeocystis_antarctica.AAC.6